MTRKLLALPLGVCLAMLLTFGAWAQEPPETQQVQSLVIRDVALLLVGLVGGWGGAFISGLWSSKNLDRQLRHEAEQNRLSREEQRQQLTIQLMGQHQMLRDQLEQQTRESMRDYRQQRVDELLNMVVAYDTDIERYQRQLQMGPSVPPRKPGVEPRLAKAALFVGSAALAQKASDLLWAFRDLLHAIEENPSDELAEQHQRISSMTGDLARLTEEYIASG